MERAEKTIHLVFGRHTNDGLAGLDIVKQVAYNELFYKRGRKLGFLVEAANINAFEAGISRQAVELGFKPSEAILGRDIFTESFLGISSPKSQIAISEDIRLLRQEQEENDLFQKKELEIMDSIALNYPGSLRLMIENFLPGTAFNFQEVLDQRLVRVFTALNTVGPDQPKFWRLFRTGLRDFAKAQRDREDRIVEDIEAELEDPAMGSVVGHLGLAHTRVRHLLKRHNYSVKSYFFHKDEAGKYYYNPADIAIRQVTMKPGDPLTRDYLLSIAFGMTLHQGLDQGADDQELIKQTHTLMSFMCNEGFRKDFDNLRKEFGLAEAILQMAKLPDEELD